MEKLGINIFKRWGPAAKDPREDPMVGIKLNGCEGTEELKKVILVIEDCLEKNFPGKVNRRRSVREFFQEET